MSDAKIDVIQDLYAAFGRGDVATILDHVTDDVDWQSESVSAVAPWHGPHKGKAEVATFFEELASSVEVLEFTPLTFAANDDDVLVTIRFGMRARATGKQGEMELHHWWHFRGDKVARYRGTEDTALTNELLAA